MSKLDQNMQGRTEGMEFGLIPLRICTALKRL